MRSAVLVCLAACAGVGTSERPTPAVTTVIEGPVAPVARPEPQPITGTHGAPIAILAVTAEGTAAVTADSRGALRMWPTLDGTREPVVVRAGAPSSLAIAHDGDGFLIANVDAAKGLELIRLDGAGRVRARAVTRGEAVKNIVMVARGVMVLREDQTIELLDADGVSSARLVPDAGTRIARLLAAGERVLAIGETGRTSFARWIEGSAWGATTTALAFDLDRPMAVSPDGKYLVVNHKQIGSLIDLATGKPGPAICRKSAIRDAVALGFIDDDTLACVTQGTLVWWSMKQAKVIGTPVVGGGDVVARDVVVSRSGHDLIVSRMGSTKQLGYATRSNTTVRFAPDGVTIARARRSLVVDASLRATSIAEHPQDEGLLAIGDGYAIGISPPEVSPHDAWGASHALSVYDLGRGVTHQELAVRTNRAIELEPATGLLATMDGPQTHLLRYDRKTHQFGAPIAVQTGGTIHRIVLLDPALSNGAVAMTVEDRATSVVLGEIDARDLGGASVKARRSYTLDGFLLAVDRAGRSYMHDPKGIRVARGKDTVRVLPITGATTVVPDAAGGRLVVLSHREVSLYLADGTHVWTSPSREMRQVRWVGTDLVASFADSLARIDLATGELAARQCGWEFGLHEVKLVDGGDAQNVCDAD